MTQYARPYDVQASDAYPGTQPYPSTQPHPDAQPWADYRMQPPPAPPASPKPSALPLVSLVIALMALFGVVAVGLGLAAFAADGGSGAGGPGEERPLTGQLGKAPAGALRGSDLAAEVTDVIADDGGEVAELRCPDTPAVGQDVTTVCHGTISGEPWAVVVFFEDRDGRFTLLPV